MSEVLHARVFGLTQLPNSGSHPQTDSLVEGTLSKCYLKLLQEEVRTEMNCWDQYCLHTKLHLIHILVRLFSLLYMVEILGFAS